MTVIHIVLFKFCADVLDSYKEEFVTELRKLKDLPCVMDSRLVVGGPSITDPIERSQGFQYALLSYHRDRQALAEYQASDEHHSVTSRLLWPFKEDVIRFDFEVAGEDDNTILPLGSYRSEQRPIERHHYKGLRDLSKLQPNRKLKVIRASLVSTATGRTFRETEEEFPEGNLPTMLELERMLTELTKRAYDRVTEDAVIWKSHESIESAMKKYVEECAE
ncbi:hypothetical protein GGR58DRAFT_507083 [Xylaria digitata]|nr:hypothetical protein GGR58DRAFT_507083 [Xylaria digitata]